MPSCLICLHGLKVMFYLIHKIIVYSLSHHHPPPGHLIMSLDKNQAQGDADKGSYQSNSLPLETRQETDKDIIIM